MADYEFRTSGPIRVAASIRYADLVVHATGEVGASVTVTASDEATAPRVELTDGVLYIAVPQGASGVRKRGGGVQILLGSLSLFPFGSLTPVRIEVRVPEGSELDVQSGSGDVTTTGRLATVEARSGSGDVTIADADAVKTTTGSGDIRTARTTTARLSTGSGDIRAEQTSGHTVVRTGSGDVSVDAAQDLEAATGSGDLIVREVDGTARLRSGSGDVEVRHARRGGITATTASGDLHVAVVAGTAALLDCTTVSGEVRSTLQQSGAPDAEEDRIELHLRTVSGDITVSRS